MKPVKRFVLHGPRPPKNKSAVSTAQDEALLSRPPKTAHKKKKKAENLEIDLKRAVDKPKKRKTVTFDLPPEQSAEDETAVYVLSPANSKIADTAKPAVLSRSGRMKHRQSSGNDSDTIEVQQKQKQNFSGDESEDDLQILEATDTSRKGPETNRPWGRKGKEPACDVADKDADDVEMLDAEATDEEIDEGFIDYDEHITSDENEDDTESIISVSSTEDQSDWKPVERPWKSANFDHDMRSQWESMYCVVTQHRVGSSWEHTEEYQREKDKEMLLYIEDYPLERWVIPKEQADQAWFRLLERSRWRSLGIPIYGTQRVPEMIPNATPYNQAVPPIQMQQVHMNIHPSAHSHHQANGRELSVSQDHGSRRRRSSNMPPPAEQTLRSQPLPGSQDQRMRYYPQPHMAGPPMGPVPPGMPYTMVQADVAMHAPKPSYLIPAQSTPEAQPSGSRKARARRETPAPVTPPPPPPTPPYKILAKPGEHAKVNKTGKRNMRRQAEAHEYPWHRDLDFQKAKAEATWDESGYDRAVLADMAYTREKNHHYIQEQDDILNEKQRRSRYVRKKGKNLSSDADGGQTEEEDDGLQKGTSEPKQKKRNENVGGDPYHSGNFCFASQADQQKAMVLKRSSPDAIIAAAEAGAIDWDICKEINICWNAGKKGQTQDLEQAVFRIYDTLITREQLYSAPIFTRRAAECIVDFCPDLLWREVLLRMASEAGFGNKDIRDRFCYNGCWADKATFTKRIAAALGQKQNNNSRAKNKEVAEADAESADQKKRSRGSASKERAHQRYAEGELEWYEQNERDYQNYITFFGKRTGHRTLSNVLRADKKRKLEMAEESGPSGNEAGPSSKRARSETEEAPTPVSDPDEVHKMEVDDADEGEVGNEEDGAEDAEQDNSDDDDAVSEQDSDVLDNLSD